FSFIHLASARDCSLHCILGDLVKQNSLDRCSVLSANLTRDMPRNCFTVPIRVPCKPTLARTLLLVLQIGKSFFLAGNGYILRLESILDVDADFFLRQIAHVTNGRANAIPASKILADGLCLCRRFDDYK